MTLPLLTKSLDWLSAGENRAYSAFLKHILSFINKLLSWWYSKVNLKKYK